MISLDDSLVKGGGGLHRTINIYQMTVHCQRNIKIKKHDTFFSSAGLLGMPV